METLKSRPFANLSRSRRERARLLILVLGILIACLVYAGTAIRAAEELRKQHALDRNFTTAQLSARLLDEQWEGVLEVLTVLARQVSLHLKSQKDAPPAIRQDLRYAVDLVPPLMFTAVYRADGTLMASYLDRRIRATDTAPPQPPQDASKTDWFRGVTQTHTLYQSAALRLQDARHTDVLVVAIPLGDALQPVGYLLAYYRLGDIDEWLQQLHMSGGVLYIVNAEGRIVDASGEAARQRLPISDHPALRRALQHREGALVTRALQGDEQAIIGYAFAGKPHWAVLVAQSVGTAYAPTDYLIYQLVFLGSLFLFLLLAAAWILDRFYRHQNQMALVLAEQNERLRVADRAKCDFLANVSHDLRTPLASMRLSLSGLLEPGLDWQPEQVRDCLRVASEGLDQLTGRVRNLLEMTRLEADAWPLQKHLCDLTDLVGAALERLAPLLAKRPLTLDFPAEPLLLECDPVQVETVIINLVENALKYTPEGTPLHLSGEQQSATVVFRLRDEGQGIPEGDTERIFEKFYRSPGDIAVGGTGLGLAICKAIIEAHRGDLGVRNVPAGGAEFWFSLPTLENLIPDSSV